MDNYLKLATDLEESSKSKDLSLEKVASAALLYYYGKHGINLFDKESMAKIASHVSGNRKALNSGVGLVLQSISDQIER